MTFFLHRKGITVPYTDILIGVSAQSEGALLLHADEHFDLLAKNFGLSVESLIDAVRVSSLQGKNNPSAGNKKEGRRIGGEMETGGERK